MLAGAAGKILEGGMSAYNQASTAKDLALTPEQLERLRELERRQAANNLGFTDAEREKFFAQSMTPVQAAEREVLARMGASQNISDIGQGAAFRQQQALSSASQAARGEVSKAVAQRDAELAEQQAQEKLRLEEQQRQAKALERQAALSLVGGVGDAAITAASVKAEKDLADELYEKNKKLLTGGASVTIDGAAQLLGINNLAKVEGANASGVPQTNGVSTGEEMVDMNELEKILEMLGAPFKKSSYDPNIRIDKVPGIGAKK